MNSGKLLGLCDTNKTMCCHNMCLIFNHLISIFNNIAIENFQPIKPTLSTCCMEYDNCMIIATWRSKVPRTTIFEISFFETVTRVIPIRDARKNKYYKISGEFRKVWAHTLSSFLAHVFSSHRNKFINRWCTLFWGPYPVTHTNDISD